MLPTMKTYKIVALALMTLVGCDDADSSASDATPADAASADAASADAATAEADAANADSATADASSDDMAVSPPDAAVDASSVAEFIAEADDFECLKNWTKTRRFYIQNTLGHLNEAIEVANSEDGGRYPGGTIIQLIPNEAMVKRGGGFNADTNDWEFFALSTRGGQTTINARGTTDVVNAFGGNCLDCHRKAAPQWDFVCDDSHGCDPLGINAATIEAFQNADPRCQ